MRRWNPAAQGGGRAAIADGDEALVFWLAGYNHWETYVFALTRDGFQWKTIPLKTEALEQKVAAFRRGLDVDVLLRRDWRGLFDLARAHELYDALITGTADQRQTPSYGRAHERVNCAAIPFARDREANRDRAADQDGT